MAAGIIALFQALPALITLLSRLGEVMGKLVKYADQNNLNAWINNLEQAVDQLEKSKTPEEKLNSAQNLANIIRNIGPQ